MNKEHLITAILIDLSKTFIVFSKEEMITMMKTCLIKQGIILLTTFVACYGIFCCWRVQKQFVFIVLSIQEWEAMRQILKEACCFDMTPAGTTEDDGDEGG